LVIELCCFASNEVETVNWIGFGISPTEVAVLVAPYRDTLRVFMLVL